MITVTRRIEWDAAHRVLGHEGKCKYLHGHRYSALVTVRAPQLDGLGRVIDFGALKAKVGGWVDEHWDHNALLHFRDPLLADPNATAALCGRPPYVMAVNPTAENIAEALAHVAAELLPPEMTVVRVRVFETPNCYADYTPEASCLP